MILSLLLSEEQQEGRLLHKGKEYL